MNIIQRIIYFIKKLLGIINDDYTIESKRTETIYELKPIMSSFEFNFYNTLKELETDYKIVPQINLASIVKKKTNARYYTDLFRNIDFAIFSKDYKKLLLLIELNDSTHQQRKRKDRDLKVKKICNDINVKLMNFYSNYPNEHDYVINRIKKEIEEPVTEAKEEEQTI